MSRIELVGPGRDIAGWGELEEVGGEAVSAGGPLWQA